jgi:hypothetical protein
MPCSASCSAAFGPMPLIAVRSSPAFLSAFSRLLYAALASLFGSSVFFGLGGLGLGSLVLGLLLRRRLGGGLLGRLGAVEQDLGDAHRGQKLPVAALAARILAAALLEGDDLGATALFHDFDGNRCAVDKRGADRHLLAFAAGQHFAELHDLADFAGDPVDLQNVLGGNAVLLASGLDDCEHFFAFRCSSGLVAPCARAVFLSVGFRVFAPAPS